MKTAHPACAYVFVKHITPPRKSTSSLRRGLPEILSSFDGNRFDVFLLPLAP
jgi:hypothetical protein